MSYILDALRKAEQQRQATEPDTVSERLLVNAPQSRQKSKKWIIALIFSNLVVIAYFAWFFSQKKPMQQQSISKVLDNKEKQPLQTEKAKSQVTDGASLQNEIAKKSNDSLALQLDQQHASPSIAQLYEEKKEALKKAEAQKSNQDIPAKKSVTVKKETSTAKQKLKETLSGSSQALSEKPEKLPTRKSMPELNDLSFDIRNNLPNLTINVFSYAHQLEDRFVIIDMVKYKTGQLIKGSVRLKEIRPDSILLEYGGETFRIERP
jgi:general secretion pathway protein B